MALLLGLHPIDLKAIWLSQARSIGTMSYNQVAMTIKQTAKEGITTSSKNQITDYYAYKAMNS